jgi:hypothetical protein
LSVKNGRDLQLGRVLVAFAGWSESGWLRLSLLFSRIWIRLPQPIRRVLGRWLKSTRTSRTGGQRTHDAFTIGSVKLDIKFAARQLKNDLRDDWFPDPLNFNDMLTVGSLRTTIEANMAANDGRYVPGRRTLFNLPKPGFTLRYALETGLADRALYHGLAGYLLPVYDKLIPWNSFSHRFDYEKNRSSDRYTFKHGIESWKHFVGSARSALTPSSFLVTTDVANFFEHIQLDRLKEKMEELEPLAVSEPSQVAIVRGYRELLFELCAVRAGHRGSLVRRRGAEIRV